MMKAKQTLPALLLVLVLFISGCTQQIAQTSFKHKSGIHFDFPDGWSMLSKKEWCDMDMCQNQALITIMDKYREAGFCIIPIDLNSNMQFTLDILGNEPAVRAVMLIESIHAAGPNKYEEYMLLEKNTIMFAGLPMAELIYQGSNPGKTLKWHRVLALVLPNETMLMLVFTAPMGKQALFKDNFVFIENSWEWGN